MTSLPQARRFDWSNLGLRVASGFVLVPTALYATLGQHQHWLPALQGQQEPLPYLLMISVGVALLAIEWGGMSAPHAPPVYVWWFLTAYTFAHGAVVVFFVLSGFLVGGAVIERARAGKAYLRTYLIDRTSRIYVVLLPTLALCAILDHAGRQIFAGLGVYEQSFYVGAFQPIYLLGSLVNMQGIRTKSGDPETSSG